MNCIHIFSQTDRYFNDLKKNPLQTYLPVSYSKKNLNADKCRQKKFNTFYYHYFFLFSTVYSVSKMENQQNLAIC